MKTKIITAIVLVILMTAALLYYFNRNNSEKVEITEMVPGGSVALLSIDHPEEVLKGLEKYSWWKSLSSIPYPHHAIHEMKQLKELNLQGKLQSKLTTLPLSLSFHITSNDKLEVLYIIENKGFRWDINNIQALLKTWKEDGGITFKERLYGNQVIVELEMEGKAYAFLIYQDYLVYSTNTVLIEDVVRTINGDATSLAQKKEDGTRSPKQGVRLLVNLEKLNDLHRIFIESPASANTIKYQGISDLEVSFNENAISLTGFSISKGDQAFFAGLKERKETVFYEKHYLPEETLRVGIYGVQNDTSLSNDTLLPYSFDLKQFYTFHQGSVSLVDLDINQQLEDRAILASINNGPQVGLLMERLAKKIATIETDTLYQEPFMGTSILFLGETEIPSQLYGEEFKGFHQSYYAIFKDLLVIGNSIDAIKSILLAYDRENTWGRRTHRRQFLDNLIASNYTQIINFQLIRDQLKTNLKPKWNLLTEENPALFEAVNLLSFQLSNATQGYYTSAQITFNEPTPSTNKKKEGVQQLDLIANAFADTVITTRPFVVKNHVNNTQEILFQDLSNYLYLVGKDGDIKWKKPIGAPIKGGIFQIDFYKNKKLQYFFASDSVIYVIDRNGNDVTGFPKRLRTDLPFTKSRVIDYDNSKRYRYITTDRRGNIYLYDKSGNPLEGWMPMEGNGPLLDVPTHIRVRGKDCFIFVQSNGIIHMTNRRGKAYPGFPFDTNNRLVGDIYLQKGPDFSRSTITVVGEGGQITTIDLSGQVKAKKQLYKPGSNSRFELVVDEMKTGYVILRKDVNKVVCYDISGESIFEYNETKADQVECHFYNFRNDSKVYVMRDKESGKTYILDNHGGGKAQLSVDTNAPLGIVYYQSRAEYEVFVNFGNQFALYRLKK